MKHCWIKVVKVLMVGNQYHVVVLTAIFFEASAVKEVHIPEAPTTKGQNRPTAVMTLFS